MAKKLAPTTFFYLSFPNGEGDLLEATKRLLQNHVTYSYSAYRNDICIYKDKTDEIETILSPLKYVLTEDTLPF